MNVLFVHSDLDDAGLSAYAFRVYCHLARRANGRSEAWPGVKSMAKTCGISESTAKRSLKELEERGMLTIKRIMNGISSNTYTLTRRSKWTDIRVGSQGTQVSQDPGWVPTDLGVGSQGPMKEIQEGNPVKKKSLHPLSEPEVDPQENTITPAQIRELWNTTCIDASPVRTITSTRFRAAKSRGDLKALKECFDKVHASEFLSGRKGGYNGRSFKADFDWVMKPTNFAKIMEGKFDNKDVDKKPSSQEGAF